ncbi:hypothetical protein ACFQ60_40155 [Streptomyces zhihengii]
MDCAPADGQDTLLATVPVTGRTAPSLPADPSPTPGEPGDGASEDPGDGGRDGIAVEQPPAAPPTQCPAEPPADGLDEDFVIQPPRATRCGCSTRPPAAATAAPSRSASPTWRSSAAR